MLSTADNQRKTQPTEATVQSDLSSDLYHFETASSGLYMSEQSSVSPVYVRDRNRDPMLHVVAAPGSRMHLRIST